MAAGKVHIIMAGNPTMPSGAFFDAFTRERALWHGIGIDAFDSPNLKGLTLEKLLQLDPLEGGALDQNSVPYVTTKRWVYDQYLLWWHRPVHDRSVFVCALLVSCAGLLLPRRMASAPRADEICRFWRGMSGLGDGRMRGGRR